MNFLKHVLKKWLLRTASKWDQTNLCSQRLICVVPEIHLHSTSLLFINNFIHLNLMTKDVEV